MQKRHTNAIYCGKREGRLTAPGGAGRKSGFTAATASNISKPVSTFAILSIRGLATNTFEEGFDDVSM